jgi:PKD repeat protein
VTKVYLTPGTFPVQVTVVVQPGGGTFTDTTFATITPNVTLNLNGPWTGQTGQPITMTASASGAPADTSFSWSFGDGTFGSGAQTSKTYLTKGTYSVTVTARSLSANQVWTANSTATITEPPQTLGVTISGPTQGSTGTPVTFTANTTGNVQGAVNFAWNFGDGGTATGASATRSYAQPGTYTVSVVATSANTPSLKDTDALTITIAASGPSVVFPPGWNLIAGPAGTTIPQVSSLFTFQPGDTAYTTIPGTQGLDANKGYWAFFNATTTVVFPPVNASTTTIQAPAGQYFMIGNSSATQSMSISGADVVFTWNPTLGEYASGTVLAPGQGAWVLSNNGGAITLTPTS